MRPVYIVSRDNQALGLTAPGYPGSASVTLEELDPEDPRGMWLVEDEPGTDICRIFLFASSKRQLLDSGEAVKGDPVTIAPPDPGRASQFWSIQDDGSIIGPPGLALGFPGDVPVPGIPIELTAAPDAHHLGDRFEVKAVDF